MPRYFIALPLPEKAKDRLVAIQPPAVPGMRILARDELHLTLHFLGEVAASDIDTVKAALETMKRNAFMIGLSGVGQFPPHGQSRVLWAGVEANAALLSLHRAVGTVLSDAIGFRPEERPYSPHVTLARLDAPVPSGVVERYLEENEGFAVPSVPIDRFVLYSSRFVDNVPKYEEETVFSLMSSTIDHVDQYVAKKGLVPLLTEGDWEAFVAYVLHLYGPQLRHRSRRITQKDELFQRYHRTFPEGLAKPYRHIRSVELLVSESPRLDDLRAWLTSRRFTFDLLVEPAGEDERGAVVGIRVPGF